jgi:hypothetical protein
MASTRNQLYCLPPRSRLLFRFYSHPAFLEDAEVHRRAQDLLGLHRLPVLLIVKPIRQGRGPVSGLSSCPFLQLQRANDFSTRFPFYLPGTARILHAVHVEF